MNTFLHARKLISAIFVTSFFLVTASAFGQQSPEFEILCPPNDGTTSNGGFSNEPLKQDLKTGQVTRLTSVERAIAFRACDQEVAISDLTETVFTIIAVNCSDSVMNGDETDIDCGGSCPNQCLIGESCLVASDCVTGTCNAANVCE